MEMLLKKKILNTSGFVTTTVLNTKISEVENKIPSTSNLVTTPFLNTKISEVENKTRNTSNLVTIAVLNTRIREVENKIPNREIYITTPEFNKLTAKSLAARLKQANLVTKTDFDIIDKILQIKQNIYKSKRN